MIDLDIYLCWLELAASLSEWTRPPAPEFTPRPRLERRSADIEPGRDFNFRGTWEETGLFAAGWVWERQLEDERGFVRRPAKDKGTSGTLGICTSSASGWPLFHCFTTSAPPFEPGKSYDRFGVYARLKHGGDMSAAARALAEAGYGTPYERTTAAPPAASLSRCVSIIAEQWQMGEEFRLAAEDNMQAGVVCYRKVGAALVVAKGLCDHGGWTAWVEENCPFSMRHAQRYMKFADTPFDADLYSQWAIITGRASEPATSEQIVPKNDTVSFMREESPGKTQVSPDETPATLPFCDSSELEQEPDPFEELRNIFITATRRANALLNAGDQRAEHLQVVFRLSKAAFFDNAEKRWKFLATAGFPCLVSIAMQETLPPEKTIELQYLEAAGAWVSPAAQAIIDAKAARKAARKS